MTFIIFHVSRQLTETGLRAFAEALHGVPGARVSRARMTAEANGHRVYFRTGSPSDARNKGLRADISIPHYENAVTGSEHLGESRHREWTIERIVETMKGPAEP